jgi:pyruvate ferredoxin oxidoreductase beta subunit
MSTQLLNTYAAKLLPEQELFSPGHRACQGCAPALAMRYLLKALGPDTMVCNATGCMEIVSSSYPETAWGVPWMHVAFENAAAVASGVEAGLKALMRKGRIPQRKITVVGQAGDGGTLDIGLQALSGALERGHDFIYLCYDNEAYMNTGIQRSSSTPYGATTTTSPSGSLSIGQQTWKKNVPMIIAAHGIPYVATCSPSYPFDLAAKVDKAARVRGPAYLHVYSCCPTGWRMKPEMAVQIGRLAVQTGVFPLYEIERGVLRLTHRTPELKPLEQYTKPQGRFRHLDEATLAEIERRVAEEYRKLERREGMAL